ncbi:MAG: S41 family peptidase [Bacteroidota bacterium]
MNNQPVRKEPAGGRTPRLRLATAILLIAAAFLSGYFLPRDDDFFALRKNFRIFGALFEEVVADYVDPIDSGRLMRAGIDGMLEQLDPYTVFLDEADQAEFDIMSRGRYGGVGLTVGLREGRLTVIAPIEGTSGFRQGVRPGDVILEIDGRSTEDMTLGDARTLLRGEPGTPVALLIGRQGVVEPLDFRLMREDVRVRDVTFAGFVHDDTARAIGYVKLDRFARNAPGETRAAIESLLQPGPLSGFILDLRDNPGGLLEGAVEIAGIFLEEGLDVVTIRGRGADSERVYRTRQAPLAADVPLIVLINEGSASASGIVAGAVQDYDRGVVVGSPSFGKGLVQTIRKLPYNTSLKMTTARYFTPSGRSIQSSTFQSPAGAGGSLRTFSTVAGRQVRDGNGIEPDVVAGHRMRSELEVALERRAAFFLYANHFAAQHEVIEGDFSASDDVLSDFRAWLEREQFTYQTESERALGALRDALSGTGYERAVASTEALEQTVRADKDLDFERYADPIKERLSSEIMARFVSESDLVRASFHVDEAILDAVAILGDPNRYADLLSPTENR